MTISETAKYLHCSESYVSKLVRGKVQDMPTLPSVRIGLRASISEEALEHWLWDLARRQRQEYLRTRGNGHD